MKKTIKALKYFILIFFLILASALCLITAKRCTLQYENGRYFDETAMTVIKEQSVLMYFSLSVIAIILSIILIINIRKKLNKFVLKKS